MARKKFPKVTIITTLHRVLHDNPQSFFSGFHHILELDYPDYEVIVVSDKIIDKKLPKTRFITTGMSYSGPGEKRDIAVKYAKGSIIAFIDDDAYPDRYWLKSAIPHFDDKLIGAVVGPGITPPGDTYLQKLGGLALSSEFCSGSTRHRFVQASRAFLEDHPTYNFIIRKDLFKKIGGFNTQLECGEDTKLCLSIIKSGMKILYDPDVIVLHHRRSLFIPHLKQIANVGLHRGYFVKKYPKTSRAPIYFLPSIFVVLFIISLGVVSVLPFLQVPFLLAMGGLLALYWVNNASRTDPLSAVIVSIAIFITHIVYGLQFIRGLLTHELKR